MVYRLVSRSSLALAITLALLVAFGFACAEQEQPFAVGDRATPTSTPTDADRSLAAAAASPTSVPAPLPTSVPIALSTQIPTPGAAQASSDSTTNTSPALLPTSNVMIEPTRTPELVPADYDRSVDGPPNNEFVKFAQWEDNRIKLSNFVAGFIVAHGLDYPVRTIDMSPEDYKDALPNNDVDIVLEADAEWAQPYADAGVIVVLKALSSASPDTVVAVNASLWERAPEVGKFLEGYAWDGELLAAESMKIKGGRIAITENVVGLSLFKKQEDVWTEWVLPTVVKEVKAAIVDRKTGFCREFEVRSLGPYTLRVCKDDPSITIRL
jgi:hypothetical protein